MGQAGKEIALITGASSGIGEAFSDSLAAREWDLVLVARRGDLLEKAAAALHAKYGVSVEVVAADLAQIDDMRRVEQRLEQGDISMLVNNAAMGGHGDFLDRGRDEQSDMIALNVTALTRLAHAACSAMLAKRSGTVINVSSGFAFDFMAGAAVYAATKAYVYQFTQVLDAELADKGIIFQCLIPGITRTNLGGALDSGLLDQFPQEMIQSPRAVAEASLKALELGELTCLPRVEDAEVYERAHEAFRLIGRETGHNRVASRYGIDFT